MSKMSEILRKQMEKGDPSVRLVKVPKDRRPTAESLAKLNAEIDAQIASNEAMRARSWVNAEKRF